MSENKERCQREGAAKTIFDKKTGKRFFFGQKKVFLFFDPKRS